MVLKSTISLLRANKTIALAVMASSPVFILRSVMVLDSKKNKELVSCTFFATFKDGSQKSLNTKSWQPIGLLRDCDKGEVGMSYDTCSLYFRDWSNNPTRGTMADNMPPALIPEEITNCFKN